MSPRISYVKIWAYRKVLRALSDRARREVFWILGHALEGDSGTSASSSFLSLPGYEINGSALLCTSCLHPLR